MKVRTVTIALTVATALLGSVHIGLTLLIYSTWTLEALWFVGSGLAIVIGGAANALALGCLRPSKRVIIILINLGMTLYFAAAWQVLPAPQVIIGALLFASLTVSTMKAGWQGAKSNG